MLETIKTFFYKESFPGRMERMLPAAMYGALLASAYSLTFSLINIYTFPNLPLGTDWLRILGSWLGAAALAALAGAIIGWFTEEYEGVVGGGAVVSVLMTAGILLSSGTLTGNLVAQSLVSVLPLIGVCMLAAGGFRWVAKRHLEILRIEQPNERRKRLAGHILLVMVIGMVPAALGRMDLPAELTLSHLDTLLKTAPSDPTVKMYLPLQQVPALEKHLGQSYLIFPRPSAMSVGTLDVTVRFADGYSLYCTLPVTSQATFITDCSEQAR